MIDLHMHTTYSDGTDTVTELLKKAEEKKLELIAITDHDEVEAHFELQHIGVKQYFTGKIITGAELRSVYKGVPIEILGYGIDIQRIKNSKYVVNEIGAEKQKGTLEDMKKIGKDIGLKFKEDLEIDVAHPFAASTFGKEIHQHLENKPVIEKYGLGIEGNDFYRHAQSNPKNVFYIDVAKHISPPEVIIREIHEAGGLAFLAHPLVYIFDHLFETIEEFIKEYEIDGLECHYPLFDDKQTARLLGLCKKHNKYVSGGSDYHGRNKPDIEIGVGRGNLKISYDIVKDWIDKVECST